MTRYLSIVLSPATTHSPLLWKIPAKGMGGAGKGEQDPN